MNSRISFFSDVLAHHLEHVLPGNILFGIDEWDIASLVREYSTLFADSWRYGWPPVEYQGDLDLLAGRLITIGVRAFVISSSHGLPGWVLAREYELKSRGQPAGISFGT